ncbi:hypothetical protein ACFFRR_000498 [Megaselia abdita]
MTSVTSNGQDKASSPRAKPSDYEEAITAAGFGRFNIYLYLFAIPACFSTVYETSTMSYILPAAECDFQITLNQKGLLNAVTYAGMITSAILWGVMADSKGRQKVLAIGLLADGVCTLAASFSQDTITLMIFKFFGGFIINGPFAILMSFLSEFHNNKMRSRVMMFVGLCFAFATLSLPGLAWSIFPQNWTFHMGSWVMYSWQIFLAIASVPSWIAGIAILFLPESPKFLMSKGRNEEAMDVFKKIYAINHGNSSKSYPIQELVHEDMEEVKPVDISTIEGKISRPHIERTQSQIVVKSFWASFIDDLKKMKVLFHKEYLGKSIHAYTLQFCILMGLNTVRLWLPQLFYIISDYEDNVGTTRTSNLCTMIAHGVKKNENNTQGTGECEVHFSPQAYQNNVIVALVGILAYLIAGCLINALGNKRLMIIGLTLCGTMGLGLYWSTTSTMTLILSSLYVNIGSISTTSLLGVIVNFFPTNLRTIVIAVVMMFGRCGALIGNVIFPYLLALGCVESFVYVGVIMLCGAFLCFFLPGETHKNNLK